MDSLLTVEKLKIHIRDGETMREVVRGIDFSVGKGEKVAIVGESGSGKSLTALALTKLLYPVSDFRIGGHVWFDGVDALTVKSKELRGIRGAGIAYVFQEPSVSLHPQLSIEQQIGEAIRLHSVGRRGLRERILQSLEEVRIPDPATKMKCYPHELSGGMQQRVMIAMALACRSSLLVADEPTTALDVTIQSEILKLLDDIQVDRKMAVLLITHNFGIVDAFADRVIVMRDGRIVEQGETGQILKCPQDRYTKDLIRCIPKLEENQTRLSVPEGL